LEFYSLSFPKGGEGRGEEAVTLQLKSAHPNPLPVWRGEGIIKVAITNLEVVP